MNTLLNLIKLKDDDNFDIIDKMYLNFKDPNEAKNVKKVVIQRLLMEDVCKNIENCNPGTKGKVLIVFDEMITNIISDKKLIPIVTELFIRGRKIKHFTCFYYAVIL